MSAAAMIDIANDDDAARASLLESPNPADGVASSSPKSILFFWADWHPPSSPGGAFDAAARALAARGDPSGAAARFYRVSAEGAPRLSRRVSENIIVLRGRDIICSFVATLERCAKSDPPPPSPLPPVFFCPSSPPPPPLRSTTCPRCPRSCSWIPTDRSSTGSTEERTSRQSHGATPGSWAGAGAPPPPFPRHRRPNRVDGRRGWKRRWSRRRRRRRRLLPLPRRSRND